MFSTRPPLVDSIRQGLGALVARIRVETKHWVPVLKTWGQLITIAEKVLPLAKSWIWQCM